MRPPTPPATPNRRLHDRERVRLRAWFRSPARTLYTRVHEVSLRGLSTRVPTPFSEGEELTVRIGERVHARARVVWTHGRSGGGMGVEFLELLDGEDELAQLIRRIQAPEPEP